MSLVSSCSTTSTSTLATGGENLHKPTGVFLTVRKVAVPDQLFSSQEGRSTLGPILQKANCPSLSFFVHSSSLSLRRSCSPTSSLSTTPNAFARLDEEPQGESFSAQGEEEERRGTVEGNDSFYTSSTRCNEDHKDSLKETSPSLLHSRYFCRHTDISESRSSTSAQEEKQTPGEANQESGERITSPSSSSSVAVSLRDTIHSNMSAANEVFPKSSSKSNGSRHDNRSSPHPDCFKEATPFCSSVVTSSSSSSLSLLIETKYQNSLHDLHPFTSRDSRSIAYKEKVVGDLISSSSLSSSSLINKETPTRSSPIVDSEHTTRGPVTPRLSSSSSSSCHLHSSLFQEGHQVFSLSSSSSSPPGLSSALSSSCRKKREERSFGLSSAMCEKARVGGEEGEREEEKTVRRSVEKEEKEKKTEEKKDCSADEREGLKRAGDRSCKTAVEEEKNKQEEREKKNKENNNKKKDHLGQEEEEDKSSSIMGCSTDSRGRDTRDFLSSPPLSSVHRRSPTGEGEQGLLDDHVEEKNSRDQEEREKAKKKKVEAEQKERSGKQNEEIEEEEDGHHRNRRMSSRKSRNPRYRKDKKIERIDEVFNHEKDLKDDKEQEEEDSACAYLQSLVRILAPEHRLSVNLSESYSYMPKRQLGRPVQFSTPRSKFHFTQLFLKGLKSQANSPTPYFTVPAVIDTHSSLVLACGSPFHWPAGLAGAIVEAEEEEEEEQANRWKRWGGGRCSSDEGYEEDKRPYYAGEDDRSPSDESLQKEKQKDERGRERRGGESEGQQSEGEKCLDSSSRSSSSHRHPHMSSHGGESSSVSSSSSALSSQFMAQYHARRRNDERGMKGERGGDEEEGFERDKGKCGCDCHNNPSYNRSSLHHPHEDDRETTEGTFSSTNVSPASLTAYSHSSRIDKERLALDDREEENGMKKRTDGDENKEMSDGLSSSSKRKKASGFALVSFVFTGLNDPEGGTGCIDSPRGSGLGISGRHRQGSSSSEEEEDEEEEEQANEEVSIGGRMRKTDLLLSEKKKHEKKLSSRDSSEEKEMKKNGGDRERRRVWENEEKDKEDEKSLFCETKEASVMRREDESATKQESGGDGSHLKICRDSCSSQRDTQEGEDEMHRRGADKDKKNKAKNADDDDGVIDDKTEKGLGDKEEGMDGGWLIGKEEKRLRKKKKAQRQKAHTEKKEEKDDEDSLNGGMPKGTVSPSLRSPPCSEEAVGGKERKLEKGEKKTKTPFSLQDKRRRRERKNKEEAEDDDRYSSSHRPMIVTTSVISNDAWELRRIEYGSHCMCGQRAYNEDRVCVVPITDIPEIGGRKSTRAVFYAVYDGHNGEEAVNFVQENLHRNIFRHKAFHFDVPKAIRAGFQATDNALKSMVWERIRNEGFDDQDISPFSSGSTACTALVNDSQLYIGNLGDSRCVLSRAGRSHLITLDHSCRTNADEQQRVREEGGHYDTDGYLNGAIGVSRAFGAFDKNEGHKLSGLSCEPQIHRETIRREDEFMIIACDGVFDVISCQEAVNCVRNHLREGGTAEGAAKALCTFAYDRRSLDNLSAVVAVFQSPQGFLQQQKENMMLRAGGGGGG
ncbi:protein phosphatase 2c domain-containing protein, partial [Cystoisospora suis]